MITYVTTYVSEELRQYFAQRDAYQAQLEYLYPGQPDSVATKLEEWYEENDEPESTLQHVADHIDHIRDRIGVDHIGIGGDYDGVTSLPTGLEDVTTYPDLLAELLMRGYTEEEVKKIAGLNVLRVMREAEQVSERLRSENPPSEAVIGDF